MTYMCPFCHHLQAERKLCKKCSFDLASNHYNPVCSKCKIKFTSMDELKSHFKSCQSQLDQHPQKLFGRCLKCGMNFYSETMFNIHLSEIHQNKEGEVSTFDDKCNFCNLGRIVDTKCNTCNSNFERSMFSTKSEHDSTTRTYKDSIVNSQKSNEQVNLWKCQYCTQVFTQYSLYQEHKINKICQDQLLQCSKCKMKFSNKYTKDKHVLQNACGNEKYAKCYFENCDVRCLRRVQLTEHLRACHGVDIKYSIKKFPSFNDFVLWKDDFGNFISNFIF